MQRPIDASLVVTQEQGENQPHITALCYKTSRFFCLFVCLFLVFFYFLNFGVGSRSGQRFRLFLLYLKCSSPFPGATVLYWPSQTFGTLGERNEKLFVPIFQYITL